MHDDDAPRKIAVRCQRCRRVLINAGMVRGEVMILGPGTITQEGTPPLRITSTVDYGPERRRSATIYDASPPPHTFGDPVGHPITRYRFVCKHRDGARSIPLRADKLKAMCGEALARGGADVLI